MKSAKFYLLSAVVALGAAAPSFAQTPGRESAAPPGEADAAPAQSDKVEKTLADLFDKLAKAPDAETAQRIAGNLERLWGHAGTDTSMVLMERAAMAQAQNKNDLALKFLTVACELQPDYVELWNRRAFIYYTLNDVDRAVGDLRRVLALEPRHYKALEGLANILREQGNKKGALMATKKLLEVYPLAPGVQQSHDELVREVEGQGI